MDSILDLWQTAPNGAELQKALDTAKQSEKRKLEEPRSAIIDPYDNYGVSGTRSKQAIIPFGMLRRMAKIPAIAAILLTRKNQVARFARRPRFDGDVGFRIGLKDAKRKMTDAEANRAHEIEEFFLRTGGVPNLVRKDNFNTFLRKITDDSLTLDAMTWELVPDLRGELAEIWAVDAATIELVANNPAGEEAHPAVYVPMTKRGMPYEGQIAYVQRLNGKIEAEYTEEMLAYAIRNPRTDIQTVDFGMSELEILIEITTAILNGVRYNTTYFTHSYLPQGVMAMIGNYSETQLEGFKKHWKNLTSGASGKWAVPIMAMKEGAGFQWTPFKNSNKDMEFSQFMDFLFNLACAVYQINPDEVGFKSWSSGNSQYKSDNTEEKMESSKDKGFVPLMNFTSDTFNSEIVDRIDPNFAYYWVGVDEEDEDRKVERYEKLINLGLRTVQELRKADDCDDLINPATGKPYLWTQAPANATLNQVFMAESGLGQQQQDGGEPGSEDDPNAEQNAADDAHGKAMEMSDDSHDKELEKQDDGHDKDMEKMKSEQSHEVKMSKMEHQQNMELEKQKAKNKPKPKPPGAVKKALDPEPLNIRIEWEGY